MTDKQGSLTFHAYARAVHDNNYHQSRAFTPEPRLVMFLSAAYLLPGGFRAVKEVEFPNPLTRETFLKTMDTVEQLARDDMSRQLQQAFGNLLQATQAIGGGHEHSPLPPENGPTAARAVGGREHPKLPNGPTLALPGPKGR